MASSIYLVIIPKSFTPCGVHIIKNNNKYYIAKRVSTNKYWEFNPHYGWNKLPHDMLKQLSNTRVADALKNENKEIILKDIGSKKSSIDN